MSTTYFNLAIETLRAMEGEDSQWARREKACERVFILFLNAPVFEVPPDELEVMRQRIGMISWARQYAEIFRDRLAIYASHPYDAQAWRAMSRYVLNRWGSYMVDPFRHMTVLKWSYFLSESYPEILFDIWFKPHPLKTIAHFETIEDHQKFQRKKIRFKAHVLEATLGNPEYIEDHKALLRLSQEARENGRREVVDHPYAPFEQGVNLLYASLAEQPYSDLDALRKQYQTLSRRAKNVLAGVDTELDLKLLG